MWCLWVLDFTFYKSPLLQSFYVLIKSYLFTNRDLLWADMVAFAVQDIPFPSRLLLVKGYRAPHAMKQPSNTHQTSKKAKEVMKV